MGSRGHHADVGGITPGSMPPFSTRIEEEGVQIHNFKLVERGVLREAEMLALLQSGEYPSRNPQQNLADLKAQIAANEKGVQELGKMVQQFSLPVVQAYMGHVQDNAEESVRRAITRLKDGAFTLPLDNGAQISVAVKVDAASRSATIDFTGTSAQQSNNFNAPTAVCVAAVLYVFRSLVQDDIPLNAGCLKPLNVIIPPGSMLNPLPPAAVVAGIRLGLLDPRVDVETRGGQLTIEWASASGDLALWYTGEEIVVFDFGSNTEVWREAVKCKKSKDPNFAYYCFGMLSPRQSKAAWRVTEGEYVLVDLKSAQKVVIPNAGWHPFFSPDDQCFSVGGRFYLTQTGEEMDNPFPFSVRQGLSFSDTCAVRTRGSLMAVQQDRGSSPIELWDTGSGQLLATIDDPFVVRQVNFAFTKSGLVLHTDYGAMSIYSCAL